MFPGGKGGRCMGLTTLPPFCADCLEIWEPQPPGTLRALQACNGIALPFIFQYIPNKMQLYIDYLYLETALHVSGGTPTHHQERIQLYLQHLVFVTPLLLPAAIMELEPLVPKSLVPTPPGSRNGVTNTRFYRYCCMRS